MVVKVLVIDTDATFCQNLSQRLLLENYQVFATTDEAEGKRIIQRERIDVVLLGLKGLKYRGLSLLKTIKHLKPLTEVILMLPAEHLALSIEGMRAGAFDDLLMPFDIETMLARIKTAHQHKQELERAKKSRSPKHAKKNRREDDRG
jgi:DNA-binding NtrC family response regulator